MKRSEINNAIKWAEALCAEHHITLPRFARYEPDATLFSSPERSHLKKTMLGWDVTDFGSDNFSKVGAVLFTVRNGSVYEEHVGTPYAEKYIFLKDGNEQQIPLHYHIHKTEDIINRAGGVFCCQHWFDSEDVRLFPCFQCKEVYILQYCQGCCRQSGWSSYGGCCSSTSGTIWGE